MSSDAPWSSEEDMSGEAVCVMIWWAKVGETVTGCSSVAGNPHSHNSESDVAECGAAGAEGFMSGAESSAPPPSAARASIDREQPRFDVDEELAQPARV